MKQLAVAFLLNRHATKTLFLLSNWAWVLRYLVFMVVRFSSAASFDGNVRQGGTKFKPNDNTTRVSYEYMRYRHGAIEVLSFQQVLTNIIFVFFEETIISFASLFQLMSPVAERSTRLRRKWNALFYSPSKQSLSLPV